MALLISNNPQNKLLFWVFEWHTEQPGLEHTWSYKWINNKSGEFALDCNLVQSIIVETIEEFKSTVYNF